MMSQRPGEEIVVVCVDSGSWILTVTGVHMSYL